MRKSTVAATCGVIVCALSAGVGLASAQGLGAGLRGAADSAQVQQKIQEQTQQRIQAQAEAQARVRAEAQAQQAAARMQQRVEAQAQNQAARAQAQGERALGAVQQRLDTATQARANAGLNAGANASAAARIGQQNVRMKTQAEVDAEAGAVSPAALFGPWNPIRGAAGIGGSANARNRGDAGSPTSDQTPTEDEAVEDEAKQPSRGLRVGQFTDAHGAARAELARSMSLRLTAISAMRDRAIEAEDLQLLEKADRLEEAVRRALDARARGQVDAQAEEVVETEWPNTTVNSSAAGSAAATGRTTTRTSGR
jgi:hypothetical protein